MPRKVNLSVTVPELQQLYLNIFGTLPDDLSVRETREAIYQHVRMRADELQRYYESKSNGS